MLEIVSMKTNFWFVVLGPASLRLERAILVRRLESFARCSSRPSRLGNFLPMIRSPEA
jgi:hypothetical protein